MKLNKYIISSVFLLIILVGVLGGVSATTYIVDDDGTTGYTTIQSAINAATSGDTIEVMSGTYEITEQINVNIHISIVGDGTVIIKANNLGWSSSSSTKIQKK
jgi:pectin methylesterase-like acyl-CoA thioesterase